MSEFPKEFIDYVQSITAKRARTVIDHILEHGFITTEDLSNMYNYDHPPRAARDVRELGIPLETFHVTGSHGRKIAAYRFGDLDKVKEGKLGGRKVWSKAFKNELINHYGSKCGICFTTYEPRYLQIDHKVPYEVEGDTYSIPYLVDFMLLCGSCNRAKSWSCEHCKNWIEDHIVEVCQTCYWAKPENHAHVALKLIRRLDVVWLEKEVPEYDQLIEMSKHAHKTIPDFVKFIIRKGTKS